VAKVNELMALCDALEAKLTQSRADAAEHLCTLRPTLNRTLRRLSSSATARQAPSKPLDEVYPTRSGDEDMRPSVLFPRDTRRFQESSRRRPRQTAREDARPSEPAKNVRGRC